MSYSDHTTRRREVFPISEADATFTSERRHNWGGYGGSSGLSAHGNIAAGSHYGGGSGLSSSGSISAGSHYGGGGGLSSSGYISSGSHYGGGGGGSSGGGGGGNSGAAAAAAAHAAFVAAATARNNAALNMLGFHTPGQQGGSQFGNLFTGRTAVSKVLGSSTGLKASGSVNPTKAPKVTLPPAPKINTSTAASTAVAQAVKPAQIKAVGNLTGAPKVQGLSGVSGSIVPKAPKVTTADQIKINPVHLDPYELGARYVFSPNGPFPIVSPTTQLEAGAANRNRLQPLAEKGILKQGEQRVGRENMALAQAKSLWGPAAKYYGGKRPDFKIGDPRVADRLGAAAWVDSHPTGLFGLGTPKPDNQVKLGPYTVGLASSKNPADRARFAGILLHEMTHTRQKTGGDRGKTGTAITEGGADAYRQHVARALGIKTFGNETGTYAGYQAQAQALGKNFVRKGQFSGKLPSSAQVAKTAPLGQYAAFGTELAHWAKDLPLVARHKLSASAGGKPINLFRAPSPAGGNAQMSPKPPAKGLSASGNVPAAPKINLPAAKGQRLNELGRLLSTAGGQQARSADTQLNQQQRELGNRASAAINVLNKQKGTGGVNPLTGQKSTPQNNARLLSQLKQILEFSKTHTSSQQLRGVINALKPGVFDEGIDYTRPGNVRAVGPGTIVSVQTGTGWPGGTFIKEKLDKPFEGHQFVYYAENIKPNVKPGQRVNTKQPVGYTPGKYPFIEVGWSVPGGADQAAAHTHYSGQHVGYSQALPEAQSFQRYLQQGGAVPPHLSNAQHAILQQADRLGKGDKQVAALRAQIKGSRNPGGTAGGGQQGAPGLSGNLKNLFVAAGKRYGVDPATLYGIAVMETGDRKSGKPFLNPSNSPVGATGWMQFMPATWAQYGVKAPGGKGAPDPHNVADAVFSAANYLKNGGHYQQGNPAAVRAAIFNYNHDSSYVQGVLDQAARWHGGAAVAGQTAPMSSSGGTSGSSGVGSAGTGSVGLSGGPSGAASPGRSGSPASAKSAAQQAQDKRQQIALNLASSLIGQQSKGALNTVLAKKGKGGKTPTLAQLLKA